ncbi:MAG TPA: RluA family pseudouridine synthase [Kofleriaceae bacterium]|nr:RluA family pseudouridine synthase [Kofleriaceae bacterium]
MTQRDRELEVAAEQAGQAVAAFLRDALGCSNAEAKRLVETGKVWIDGRRAERAGDRVATGQRVEVRMAAPRPRDGEPEVRIEYEDAQLVVIDKPAGVSTVPFETRERGTAMDLLRDAWRRRGEAATQIALHVVHRIDKDTSGLVVFAKTKRAERGLGAQFRAHTVERRYLCLAHGDVRFARAESLLVRDRGDGLRGSSRVPNVGKRAVTHVEVVERFPRATLCHVRLETGKTHQIRIHFSEWGHPLVGETVYIRDHENAGRPIIASPRLMLHAEQLGFLHPVTGARHHFQTLATSFTRDDAARLASAR